MDFAFTLLALSKQMSSKIYIKISGYYTATNPSPSSHLPVGLNFLFHNFESKI